MHNRSAWSCWDCQCCDSDAESLPQSIVQIRGLDVRNTLKQRTSSKSVIQKLLKERIKTKKSEEQIIQIEQTPNDRRKSQIYKYQCPICLIFFNTILVFKCCNNYICFSCAKSLISKQEEHKEFTCPHCSFKEYFLVDVNQESKVRIYSDNLQNLLDNFVQNTSNKKDKNMESYDSIIVEPISNLQNMSYTSYLKSNEKNQINKKSNKENCSIKEHTEFPNKIDLSPKNIHAEDYEHFEKEGKGKKLFSQIKNIIEKRNNKIIIKKDKLNDFEEFEKFEEKNSLNNSLVNYNFTFSGIKGILNKKLQRNIIDFDLLAGNSTDEFLNENATIRKIRVNKSINNLM